jgi:serine protease AprX
MRNVPKASILFILLVLLLSSASTAPGVITSAAQETIWQSKVDPWVLETGTSGETEFLVFLTEQADLSGAADLNTKFEKGTYVYEQLTAVAARTQPAVAAALEKQGVQYRTYWVANMIWVRGGLDTVQVMSERSDVAHIYANPTVKANVPEPDPAKDSPDSPEAIEWNILKVNADDVWAAGFTGLGAVIGGADTGYDWDHPALKNQYRGWNGASADHNYHWHDAIHSGISDCGPNSQEPCDDHGHGTHTMGTMVGDDGVGNQIGMAPGARWIGCRNMNEGVGSPATYTECYQWFIAPTDLNDQNPDPSKAPDVINNSWGCPPNEGCTDPNVLLSVVNAVRAAGIVTAHSAGNNGILGCSSVNQPAAIYDASFTVGATDSSDTIAGFSSRGPVTVDGSGRLKPDVSAPGVSIRSSVPGGGYQGGWSGTSMAAPHVAGLVGLLISANPLLSGQVDTLESIINQSALPRTTSQSCGGIPGAQIPNNTYGHGRIDALAALQTHTFLIDKSSSVTEVFPTGLISYTINITHINASYPTSNVVITDTLPGGTVFVSATQPYSFDGSTIRWDFTSMGANETKSVDLVVQVSSSARGTVDNIDYGVRSDDAATVTGDLVSVNVATLDHMLTKTAPAIVPPSGILTYTLAVTNPYSSLPIHNVVLTDVVPVNTTFITATVPVVVNGDMLTWTLPVLAAGESWENNLVVQAPLVYAGEIVNQNYGVRSDESGTITGAPVTSQVHSLALAKSATPELADIGDLITYTLTVTNQNKMSTTHNIILEDLLPDFTAYVSSDGVYDPASAVVTWTKPDLLPGQTWQTHLTVAVLAGAYETIDNSDYTVKSDETPQPLYGAPVSTRLQSYRYFPLVFKSNGG